MKQFVKKKVSFVMVMIMAVITVISMSLPMAVFAQGGGYTLTLKNEGSTPHTFQIYQIFSGDLDESKTLSNIQWGTGIKEASKETLGTAAEKAQTLTGESEAKEFAKTIQEHLNEDNKLEVRVEKNDSTTVANLNAGYYLIKDKEGSQTQTPPNSAYIKVQKVNKSGESLEGAAFRLEKLGDASFTPVEMGNESAISDFTFKCLDAGEYRLTEIKAPSNYIPLEEPILFTIIEESNGVFKIKLNTENSKVTLEEGTLTIKVANEKTVTTEITVDKKWFRADGTEFHPQDGEISYNLIQVLTTEGGESSEKIYKSGETLTSQDGWQKTYSNLPAADINGNGEKEICTYYVKEILIADYSTSYSNGSVGESEDPSAAALSSGTITVKNTEKMKFILPETGGTGRGILYIAGVFLLGISMILLGNKNSSFYECLHKKG